MKRFLSILILLLLPISYAETSVFNENGKFGLKSNSGEILADAKYKKLIKLGNSGWIFQLGSKFGIMSDAGEVLVEPKYTRAERVLGKFVKLTKYEKTGLFDEKGFEVLPVEYSSIDLLFGGMFLTCKNYKYGVADFNGNPIIDNVCDDIYMPKPNEMVIVYNGEKYVINGVKQEELTLPSDIFSINEDSEFSITKSVVTTGYYGVNAANYAIKLISSISPAYEETIDELMFLQGADAADAIMRFSWIPKFPIVYVKKYYQNIKAPNNGPLSEVKNNLKKHINQ